jgi:hypothetical protein
MGSYWVGLGRFRRSTESHPPLSLDCHLEQGASWQADSPVRNGFVIRTAEPPSPTYNAAKQASRDSLSELFAQLCDERNISKASIARRWGVDESYVRQVMTGTRAWTIEKMDQLPVELFDALLTAWRRRRGLDDSEKLTDVHRELLEMTIELGHCADQSRRRSWNDVAVHAAALRRKAARLEAYAREQSTGTLPTGER